ncbi:SLAM family member 5-like [Colossoma macropomum]|uniref:SLAM family member 5-like n=1 Tax=Colossoma macropomum TaxID=42526 RepID=UPI001864AF28|nr:SLAM family member 5-like [Colossoma macropomum]
MAMVVQLLFVLFSFVSIAEPSNVFRLVNNSVQLDIQHLVTEKDDLFWVLNETKNVLKYNKKHNDITPSTFYEGRVEFNKETYSLTLKNLQKTDSGLYKAKASGDVDRVVAEYRLSVLDPVEAPVLTHQLSRDTCNITLTCRGHDLSINSSCYKETCKKKEVTSPEDITLSLSVSGSTIICNHSNPVGWKKDVLEMRELKRHCADEGLNWLWLLAVAVGFFVLIVIIIIFLYRCQKRSTGPIQCENTVYAEVERNGAASPPIALESPSTVYSVVGKKPQPTSNGQSSQTPVPENEQSTSADITVPNTYESVPDQMQLMKPETIYATVSKPSKAKPSKAVNQAK